MGAFDSLRYQKGPACLFVHCIDLCEWAFTTRHLRARDALRFLYIEWSFQEVDKGWNRMGEMGIAMMTTTYLPLMRMDGS